ncbi:glycoside hydrolase family 61 protein [Xylariomycetidae sp. FL0641]|nr:glycoside hydrolase family 61 protein [Xylariomycetidae sp. FL0641]
MAPRFPLSTAFAGALLAAAGVRAHGIASAIVVGSTFYNGYNPSYQYQNPPPTVVGWSVPDDLQNTFISPDQFATPDIACHVNAKPAGAAAPVKGGDVIEVQWTPWPASHKGPVLDYLARCNGPCEKADKTKLEFFKIGEAGWLDPAKDAWASIELMNNNNSWLVRVPEDLAPGDYVLRHEIISLHNAGNPNGAQAYPFCYNLVIDSTGTAKPAGVPAAKLYQAGDPGIKFDLFGHPSSYVIPGPTLYSGALSVAQSKAGKIMATASGIYAYGETAGPKAREVPRTIVDSAPTTLSWVRRASASRASPASPAQTTPTITALPESS